MNHAKKLQSPSRMVTQIPAPAPAPTPCLLHRSPCRPDPWVLRFSDSRIVAARYWVTGWQWWLHLRQPISRAAQQPSNPDVERRTNDGRRGHGDDDRPNAPVPTAATSPDAAAVNLPHCLSKKWAFCSSLTY